MTGEAPRITATNWEDRWQTGQTPWDLMGVTPALVSWKKLNKINNLHILVPGCGRGHDAYFLGKHGAKVTAVDYAASALDTARHLYGEDRVSWELADVTRMSFDQTFDRIWEYTCFCALNPELRDAYLGAVQAALKPGGAYWGLVFSRVPQPDNGPPFQIDEDAFHELLARYFQVDEFERQTNRSVKARRGGEIWFSVHKPNAT